MLPASARQFVRGSPTASATRHGQPCHSVSYPHRKRPLGQCHARQGGLTPGLLLLQLRSYGAASSWEGVDCTAVALCWKEQPYALPRDMVCRSDTVEYVGKLCESCLGTKHGVSRFQYHPGDSAAGLGTLDQQGRAAPPTRPGRGQTGLTHA